MRTQWMSFLLHRKIYPNESDYFDSASPKSDTGKDSKEKNKGHRDSMFIEGIHFFGSPFDMLRKA